MADADPLHLSQICAKCRKPGTKTHPLKPCAKCKTTYYCSRDCQKSDWKSHKKCCAQNAQERADRIASIEARLTSASASVVASLAPISGVEATEQSYRPQPSLSAPSRAPASSDPESSRAAGNRRPALAVKITNPFQRLKEKHWLYDRPKEDVYKLLIDAFRLRLDDDFKFLNLRHADTIYDKPTCNGTPNLDLFLRMAELCYLLPTWWNERELISCLERANLPTWSDISTKVTANDVKSYYGDPSIALQLRFFAEQTFEKDRIGINFLILLNAEAMMERASELINYVHWPLEVKAEAEAEEHEHEHEHDDEKPKVDLG